MQPIPRLTLVSLMATLLTGVVLAQTYRDDSLVVVEILAANGLDTVPVSEVTYERGPERIRSLDLDQLGLKELPAAIGRLTELTTLSFSNNELSTLPESFGQLVNLTYLTATDNQLYELPETFKNLDKLVMLYFIRNRFTRWPAVFDSMPNLPMIDLGGNNLTEVPEQIASYPSLQRLYINDNYLTALPEAFSTMELEVVHVARNALCDVSDALTVWLDTYDYYKENSKWKEYQSCEYLRYDSTEVRALLDTNGWTDVPLTNVVTIENGDIVAIDLSPEARSAGQPLRKTTAQSGGTLILPVDLTYLKHLRSLNLSGNGFDSLPELLGEFCHLKSLDLSANNLTTLPDFMASFRMLDSLDLSGNMLVELPSPLEAWADTHAPDWQATQQTVQVIATNVQTLPRAISIHSSGYTAGTIRLVMALTAPFNGEAALYSLSGQKVAVCSSRNFSTGKNFLRFDGSRISRGAYLFRFTGNNGMTSAKRIALF